MEIEVRRELVHWRGPAPFHFVPIPAAQSAKIRALAPRLTYGWGVIPVACTIDDSTFTTSLFPKDGLYLVPIKNAVRSAEGLELGQLVSMELQFTLNT